MQILFTRKLLCLWKSLKENQCTGKQMKCEIWDSYLLLLLFVLVSRSISIALLWSPLQWEQKRAAESQQSYKALRRTNQWRPSFISKRVNEGRKKTNSSYEEALQKSNIVEIFGICADTSWFSLASKEIILTRKNSNLDRTRGGKMI